MHGVAPGADVTPGPGAYPYPVPYGWADDDTARVLALKRTEAQRGHYPGDLLACDVPDGTGARVTEARVDPVPFAPPVVDPVDT